MTEAGSWKELFLLFFRLGCTAFGGPAAHIAMLKDEVVDKKQWMDHQHFLDLVGATNLIPGPNSTEMVLHCGYERAGRMGMVVAGLAFICPAVVLTGILAWLYAAYGQLPQLEPFVYGIRPAVIAIVLYAGYTLSRTALKSAWLGVLGVLTLVSCLLGMHEIIALFGAGMLGLAYYWLRKPAALPSVFPVILLQALATGPQGNMKLFLVFLKIGALLYGSGYVLFAFLDAELVSKGWISEKVLLDAVAAGQFTPGPVLSTATFIGWQLDGWSGALLATVGIFLPSFLFVAVLNPWVPTIRKKGWMAAFLDAVNIASVALIICVGIEMSVQAMGNWKTILIALVSLAVLVRFKKLNSAYVILGGAVAGYLLHVAHSLV